MIFCLASALKIYRLSSNVIIPMALISIFALGLIYSTRRVKFQKLLLIMGAMVTFLAWIYARVPDGLIDWFGYLPEPEYPFGSNISPIPFGNIDYAFRSWPDEGAAYYGAINARYFYLFFLTTFLLAFLLARIVISFARRLTLKKYLVLTLTPLLFLEALTLFLNFHQFISSLYDYGSFILDIAAVILAWLLTRTRQKTPTADITTVKEEHGV